MQSKARAERVENTREGSHFTNCKSAWIIVGRALT
jgi:hypothetical protein